MTMGWRQVYVWVVLIMAGLASLGQSVAAAPLRQATVSEFEIGRSTEGRPITAWRFGDGPRKLVLVGNTHGFPEANTYTLAMLLIEHFRTDPALVPASVRLYIIPTLNPDGLALGSRFNARGVDLNRNMNTTFDACPENDWQVTVQGAYGIVSDTGGAHADSEIESQIIRDFLVDASAAIFFHSNAGNVFPAACEHAPSIALAQAYAAGSAYAYARRWEPYNITGGMHDWAGSLDIAAIIPEFITGDLPEFEENLGGVLAVLANAEALVPLPRERVVLGIALPEPIWRFWRMHGGYERFGRPLAPAATDDAGVTRQPFTTMILELDPARIDTVAYIRALPLGLDAAPHDITLLPTPADARIFAETGAPLYGAFETFWQRAGATRVFGLPVSDEYEDLAADGTRRIMQRFERAVFAYYPETNQVRLEPLGWYAVVRQRLDAAMTRHHLQ